MKQSLLSALCAFFICVLNIPAQAQCEGGLLPATFEFTTCCVAEVTNSVNYVIYNETEEVEAQGVISLNGAPGIIQYDLCLPEGCYYTTFSYTAGFGTSQHLESFEVVGENTSSFNIFQTTQNIPFSFGFCVVNEAIACQAAFTPTILANGVLSVNNTSTPSTGYTSLYGWDYGNGSNVQGFDPDYTYSENGIYEVCLFQALYDGDIPVCFSDTCVTIEMTTVPDNSGCPTEIILTEGEICGHYVLSHNGELPGSNYWFVDDALEGTTSDLNISFNVSGEHQICLAHASATCESSATVCITLEVPDCSNSNCPENISFEEVECHTYTFSVDNMGAYGNMVWTFGDGTTSAGQNNVTHTFDSLGVYEVCIEAWNSYCQDGITLCTTVEVAPCGGTEEDQCNGNLYFTYESECGHVHFEGGQNLGNQPVYWNFGDGPGITTATVVADHYYETPGIYTVTALVSTDGCPNNITLYTIVNIEDCFVNIECPTSMFTGVTNDCSEWAFEIGSATPGEAVIWSYGDETTIEGGHYSTHAYENPGEYLVCAQYSSDNCPEGVELCETVVVDCQEPCTLSIEQIPTACGVAIMQANTNNNSAEIHWSINGVASQTIGQYITFALTDATYTICAWYNNEDCGEISACSEIVVNNCNECTELSFGFDSFIGDGGTSFLAWSIQNIDNNQYVQTGMAQFSMNDPYYDEVTCLEDGCYLLTATTNSPFDFNAVTAFIGPQAETISIDAFSLQGDYGYEILFSLNGDCSVDCDMVGFNYTSYPSYGGMAAVEWTLRNSANELVASDGNNFENYEVAEYFSDCLPEDCYTLVFMGNQSFENNAYFSEMISGFWTVQETAYGMSGNLHTLEITLNLNSNCENVACELELTSIEVETGVFEFTAIGTPEVYPMFWNFGDGQSLEATWVTMHSYPEPGEYEICAHIQTDVCGILEACTTIVVEGDTPCDYSIWTGPGQECGDVIFEIPGGAALGPVVWIFGNEIITDNQSIMHHFDLPGSYLVYATASSNDCPNVELVVEVIVPECNDCSPVSLLLVSNVNTGSTNCVAVNLTNIETNESTMEVFEFSEEIMTHQWNQCLADGCYSLSFDSCLPLTEGSGLIWNLTVNDMPAENILITGQDNYSISMLMGINSTCFDGTCEAYFEYETTNVPGEIQLTNSSYTGGGDASYSWSLGNGYETIGDISNYSYLQNGTYEVCLHMYTNLCENTYCQNITLDNTDCNETGAIITLTSDFQLQNMSDVLNIMVSIEDETVVEFIQEVTPFNTYTLPVCLPDGCYILDLVSFEPLEALGIFANITSNNASIGGAEILSGSFYGGAEFGINNDCTDAVDETDLSYLSAYPNPASNQLQWTVPSDLRISTITLTNHIGQVVQKIQPNDRSIDVSHLASGMYYIQFMTNKGVFNQKIQITH